MLFLAAGRHRKGSYRSLGADARIRFDVSRQRQAEQGPKSVNPCPKMSRFCMLRLPTWNASGTGDRWGSSARPTDVLRHDGPRKLRHQQPRKQAPISQFGSLSLSLLL